MSTVSTYDAVGAPASSVTRARMIAFYLPQFHPIPENDAWWGKGFTEWTNVARARPLFPDHDQPRIPSELGYYDLRLPDVRAAQAELAQTHGIEGFCYWHYWFAGKRLLQRPFNEVLESGEPDFPFCLAWANQSWSGIWHGAPDRILQRQTYPGPDDYKDHFRTLLPAFFDQRYITVHGKPLFVLFAPQDLPDCRAFAGLWREWAVREGLPGLHLVGLVHRRHDAPDPASWGLDGIAISNQSRLLAISRRRSILARLRARAQHWIHPRPRHVYPYRAAMEHFIPRPVRAHNIYPCVVPNWDNTPRSHQRGLVLHNSTPELFRRHVQHAVHVIEHKPSEDRLVFIKSWNEWAEGNYLEPDGRFGRAYLEVLRDELLDSRRTTTSHSAT